ncbi:uncharacterized protein CC84DRAFT_1182163 [Paraphaeosphaeria sporulosa]|uniref:Uncharacterized protein n=1 Tax=Paraphaeosphaeria sporulosa TaxID=1460663 RepID=A0A177BTK7_9PLEO|nr:uncharacterized protein CC84DRAFT_1182163 [Paraphaeosphaeria sporulosa]OAF98485.1 hypothetical protein CC84DRAFT_1182163 [Paraphaeosphaeria sporulosa]
MRTEVKRMCRWGGAGRPPALAPDNPQQPIVALKASYLALGDLYLNTTPYLLNNQSIRNRYLTTNSRSLNLNRVLTYDSSTKIVMASDETSSPGPTPLVTAEQGHVQDDSDVSLDLDEMRESYVHIPNTSSILVIQQPFQETVLWKQTIMSKKGQRPSDDDCGKMMGWKPETVTKLKYDRDVTELILYAINQSKEGGKFYKADRLTTLDILHKKFVEVALPQP